MYLAYYWSINKTSSVSPSTLVDNFNLTLQWSLVLTALQQATLIELEYGQHSGHYLDSFVRIEC